MKRIITLFTLLITIIFESNASSTSTEISIVPASHPNSCVALQLENLSAGSHTWTFNPAVVNAATGMTVSSVNATTGSEPIVYWTTVGDKQVCYDGTCEWFHSCNCNPLAADDFENAPLVCNTELYCGTTSSAYGADHEGDIEHEGSIENNSWIEFVADASDVVFNISVESGCYIQFAVYQYNTSAGGSSYTLMTDIDWTDIDVGFTGTQTITASGMTPGTSYYLHFDGHGGAECDYEIGFQSGVQVLEVAASATTVCSGDPTTLTVTPNDPGATYTWTDNQGGGPYPNSSSIVVNPTVTTTYTVDVSGGSCSISDSYDVTVNIDPGCAPCANPPTLNLSSTSGSTCVSTPITINGNTFGGSATSVIITENGAGSVSPTSSGSSPFGFTYTPAAGDAGNNVTITVTTNNPLGAPCTEAIQTYTLSVTPETTPTFTQVPAICQGDALS
ncbi:MAG: hypothetical protein KDD29_03025, partial [Flavobacteriales bacterium]|nr:hypothetical protein [Flavobacteriales bacterium]